MDEHKLWFAAGDNKTRVGCGDKARGGGDDQTPPRDKAQKRPRPRSNLGDSPDYGGGVVSPGNSCRRHRGTVRGGNDGRPRHLRRGALSTWVPRHGVEFVRFELVLPRGIAPPRSRARLLTSSMTAFLSSVVAVSARPPAEFRWTANVPMPA